MTEIEVIAMLRDELHDLRDDAHRRSLELKQAREAEAEVRLQLDQTLEISRGANCKMAGMCSALKRAIESKPTQQRTVEDLRDLAGASDFIVTHDRMFHPDLIDSARDHTQELLKELKALKNPNMKVVTPEQMIQLLKTLMKSDEQ